MMLLPGLSLGVIRRFYFLGGINPLQSIPLELQLSAALNTDEFDGLLIDQPYDYKSIFISKILPDESNPRFFPSVIISDLHAYQLVTRKLSKGQLIALYDAKDKVAIGKSCLVNCFTPSTQEWKKANRSIESILDLARNVAVSEIIQVPTIYPEHNGTYRVLTGHRRFFAMVYANGINGAAYFKVYNEKPILPKTKQFQENASREDLPQYGKLQAFQDAMLEVETLSTSRIRLGKKQLTVRETANMLGVSMGAYDNYNVLVRYPAVIDAYNNGNTLPFLKMKNIVLTTEANYKKKKGLALLSNVHKRAINAEIKLLLQGDKPAKNAEVKPYKIGAIKSPQVLKQLLTANVTQLDTGVDWESLDWESSSDVNQALSLVLGYLERQAQ